LLGAPWGADNRGVGLTRVPAIIPEVVNTRFGPHRTRNIVVVMSGLNDLYIGRSAVDTYADLAAVCSELLAFGWEVIVCTVTAANPLYFPQAERLAYNDLIRAGAATIASRLADPGANEFIGVTGADEDPTYFIDRVHPTAAGHAILAAIIHTEILAL
jgi:lysophospholipase L1-like esterase